MNLDAKKKLGEVVRKTRGHRSLREFSRLLSVSPTTVQGWENGDYVPEIDSLVTIATMAGYTVEELIAYVNSREVARPQEIDRIINQIRSLPVSQVATIVKVGTDRLASLAIEG